MQVNELKHGWPLRKRDWDGNWEGISGRFFENQPNEICSHLSEKASKGTFLKPEKLQDHSNELRKRKGEKERARRRKGGEEKQAVVSLLVFIIPTLEIVLGRKKLFHTKGPFGDNVIKNSARYISIDVTSHFKISRANVP